MSRMLFLPFKQQRHSTEIEFGLKQRVKCTKMYHFPAGYSKHFSGEGAQTPSTAVNQTFVMSEYSSLSAGHSYTTFE